MTVFGAEKAAGPARWHDHGVQLPGMLRFTLATKGPSQSTGRLWLALCCDEVPSDHQNPSLTGRDKVGKNSVIPKLQH